MAFTIRIDDGFCEYSCELPESFGEDFSISDLYIKIYNALKIDSDLINAKLTKSYYPTSKSE